MLKPTQYRYLLNRVRGTMNYEKVGLKKGRISLKTALKTSTNLCCLQLGNNFVKGKA
jgi:hypothetical protein